MELTPDIRERLQRLMQEKGETGYSLNRKLGISATTISNYLNGKITKADNTKIKAICELLGKDITWLETGTYVEDVQEEITSEQVDELLKQILLRLNGREDSFSVLRKDILHILNDINLLKKEVSQLKEKIAPLSSN